MRSTRTKSYIPPKVVEYIELALLSQQSVSRKQALQLLCSLYRKGGRALNEQRLKACIFSALTDPDDKVKRWAFNAMAQIGEPKDIPLLLKPWENSRKDDDAFAAGLSALAHILPRKELEEVLAKADVPVNANTILALSQQTNSFQKELNDLRLDVDNCSASQLRSATVLIGLDKSPDTLFSNRFPVSSIIGEFNSHSDAIVAQYSFWAAVERPDFGIRNIKIAPRDFHTLPWNVQSWAYRVLTKENETALKHYDAIVTGSESESVQVREGVAIGLRDIYYDSLDITVCDWLVDEKDPRVIERLLEHMAVHLSESREYKNEVLSRYRSSDRGSLLRSRLEAANTDKATALEFRKIVLQTSDPDLFSYIEGSSMTNIQNFNGPVNVGGMSNAGTGLIGNAQIWSEAEARLQVLPILEELKSALSKADADPKNDAGITSINEAITSPTKSNVTKVFEWLKTANDGGQAIAGLGGLIAGSIDKIGPLLASLPLLF
jgi:hypothetical protein